MAQKKDFTANAKRQTAAEQLATATQETTRKERKTYSAAEAEQIKANLASQGRKGVKVDRINMAFTPENYDYVKTMAAIKGQTMTQFLNDIVGQSLKKNKKLYEQAKEFANNVKEING